MLPTILSFLRVVVFCLIASTPTALKALGEKPVDQKTLSSHLKPQNVGSSYFHARVYRFLIPQTYVGSIGYVLAGACLIGMGYHTFYAQNEKINKLLKFLRKYVRNDQANRVLKDNEKKEIDNPPKSDLKQSNKISSLNASQQTRRLEPNGRSNNVNNHFKSRQIDDNILSPKEKDKKYLLLKNSKPSLRKEEKMQMQSSNHLTQEDIDNPRKSYPKQPKKISSLNAFQQTRRLEPNGRSNNVNNYFKSRQIDDNILSPKERNKECLLLKNSKPSLRKEEKKQMQSSNHLTQEDIDNLRKSYLQQPNKISSLNASQQTRRLEPHVRSNNVNNRSNNCEKEKTPNSINESISDQIEEFIRDFRRQRGSLEENENEQSSLHQPQQTRRLDPHGRSNNVNNRSINPGTDDDILSKKKKINSLHQSQETQILHPNGSLLLLYNSSLNSGKTGSNGLNNGKTGSNGPQIDPPENTCEAVAGECPDEEPTRNERQFQAYLINYAQKKKIGNHSKNYSKEEKINNSRKSSKQIKKTKKNPSKNYSKKKKINNSRKSSKGIKKTRKNPSKNYSKDKKINNSRKSSKQIKKTRKKLSNHHPKEEKINDLRKSSKRKRKRRNNQSDNSLNTNETTSRSTSQEDFFNGQSPLIYAAARGYYHVVCDLLNKQGHVKQHVQQVDSSRGSDLPKKQLYVNQVDSSGISALQAACFAGHTRVVRRLLREPGIDVNQMERGMNALLEACRAGNTHIVRLLLEDGRVNVNLQGKNGWSPLMVAFNNGYLDIAGQLLDKNAAINTQSEDGQTALIMACNQGWLFMVDLALEYESIDLDIQEKNGWTALMIACGKGYADIVDALLKKNAGINIQTEKGQTALMIACNKKFLSIVWLLVKDKRIDLDIQEENGWTALMVACRKGYVHLVKCLLDNSAAMNKQAKNEWTALMMACDKGQLSVVKELTSRKDQTLLINLADSYKQNALLIACMRGHESIVLCLLSRKDIDVSLVLEQNKYNAYMFACEKGMLFVVKVLLTKHKKKAGINAFNENGNTGIMLACQTNAQAVIHYLLKEHANDLDLNRQNIYGKTFLILCLRNRRLIRFAKMILKKKKLLELNLDLEDYESRNALYYAKQLTHSSKKGIIQLINS